MVSFDDFGPRYEHDRTLVIFRTINAPSTTVDIDAAIDEFAERCRLLRLEARQLSRAMSVEAPPPSHFRAPVIRPRAIEAPWMTHRQRCPNRKPPTRQPRSTR
jgi:hypothetical protein